MCCVWNVNSLLSAALHFASEKPKGFFWSTIFSSYFRRLLKRFEAFFFFFTFSLICLKLYINCVSIDCAVGKLPASQANAEAVSAFRREEKERKMKLLQNYLRACSIAKVCALFFFFDFLNQSLRFVFTLIACIKLRSSLGKNWT